MNDPKEIPAAARSAWYTMFCRFGIGTNRLIWYGQLRRADISAQKKEWETQIRHAWDVLDEEMFANTIYDIFSVPRAVETTKDFAEFVHEIGAIAEEGKESFFQKTGLEAPEDREVSPNPGWMTRILWKNTETALFHSTAHKSGNVQKWRIRKT